MREERRRHRPTIMPGWVFQGFSKPFCFCVVTSPHRCGENNLLGWVNSASSFTKSALCWVIWASTLAKGLFAKWLNTWRSQNRVIWTPSSDNPGAWVKMCEIQEYKRAVLWNLYQIWPPKRANVQDISMGDPGRLNPTPEKLPSLSSLQNRGRCWVWVKGKTGIPLFLILISALHTDVCTGKTGFVSVITPWTRQSCLVNKRRTCPATHLLPIPMWSKRWAREGPINRVEDMKNAGVITDQEERRRPTNTCTVGVWPLPATQGWLYAHCVC